MGDESHEADEIYWELIDNEPNVTKSATSAETKDKTRIKLLQKSQEYEDDSENKDIEDPMTDFLFRRRRSSPPPPPSYELKYLIKQY